jgi:hypothetical protein
MIAAKYNPDGFKSILDSKYFKMEMLHVEIGGQCCLDVAFEYQPKSLKYLLESSAPLSYINRQNSVSGWRLLDYVNRVYSFKDVNELRSKFYTIPLTNYTNEIATDGNVCNICLQYKNKIFYTPCGHTSCVGCSFHIMECPYCNKKIMARNLIYV